MIEDGSSVTFSHVSVLTPVLQTKPSNNCNKEKRSTETERTEKQTEEWQKGHQKNWTGEEGGGQEIQ